MGAGANGRDHTVIIGNGPAAVSALGSICQTNPNSSVTVISREPFPAYSPTSLSYLLAGEVEESGIFINDEAYYADHGVELILGSSAEAIDVRAGTVVVTGRDPVEFDHLLIATGASPVIPDIVGLAPEEALTLRTLDDARKISGMIHGKRSAAVLGGGLIGLQTAQALRARGLEVCVVEREPRLLPLNLDQESAEYILSVFESNGVKVLAGDTVAGVDRIDGGSRKRLSLESGATFETDLFIIAVGVRANISFLEGSGIAFGRGVLVDESMRTNCDRIYAAGDVAEASDFFGRAPALSPVAPSAAAQGSVAGANISGGSVRYEGGIPVNLGSFFGHKAFSVGLLKPLSDAGVVLVGGSPSHRSYHKLIFEHGRLVGAIFVDEPVDPGIIYALIANRVDLSGSEDRLNQIPARVCRQLAIEARW